MRNVGFSIFQPRCRMPKQDARRSIRKNIKSRFDASCGWSCGDKARKTVKQYMSDFVFACASYGRNRTEVYVLVCVHVPMRVRVCVCDLVCVASLYQLIITVGSQHASTWGLVCGCACMRMFARIRLCQRLRIEPSQQMAYPPPKRKRPCGCLFGIELNIFKRI